MAKRKKVLNTDGEVGPLALPVKPMRRGSMSQRFTKCSKPGCKCTKSKEGRHGPYFSLTRVVDGKTTSRWVPADQAEVVQRQLADGDQFRREVEAYWGACEEQADAELEGRKEVSSQEAEKGGSSRRSSPASSRRSRGL
jgi:hypothetical protein